MALSEGSYIGEFKEVNGEIINHGKGTFEFDNGNKYDGDWKDGKYDGFGEFTHATGEKYQGFWKDNNKNGLGVYDWGEGNKYIGEFKDDMKHGKGIQYFKYDKEDDFIKKYEGFYQNDKKDIYGILNYEEGIYEGEWKNNKKMV